jgi:hypothetical protein
LSDATQAVLLTGLFTLSGVVITSIAAGVGSVLRRKWAVQDAQWETRVTEQRELRSLRRDTYAELLAAFDHHDDDFVRLAGKIRLGTVPKITDLSSDHERTEYILEHVPRREEVDALAYRSIVVAGDTVADLIRQAEGELARIFFAAADGQHTWEDDSHNEYYRIRRELTDAMRAELTSPMSS